MQWADVTSLTTFFHCQLWSKRPRWALSNSRSSLWCVCRLQAKRALFTSKSLHVLFPCSSTTNVSFPVLPCLSAQYLPQKTLPWPSHTKLLASRCNFSALYMLYHYIFFLCCVCKFVHEASPWFPEAGNKHWCCHLLRPSPL